MNQFTVKRYTLSLKSEWDQVVTQSKNGNFLHLRNYMDYHVDRFDEQSILFFRNGTPLAIFPCNRVDNIIISHSGLTYAGLIYGTELKANEVITIFSIICEYYKALGANVIRYKAVPHIFHRYPAEEDIYALFLHRAHLTRRDLSTAIPIEHKLKLSDSRKNTIRKAEKNNLTLVDDKNLNEFHSLLSSVLKKFDAKPVHSIAELTLLQSRFPNQIKLYTARKSGELLAGSILYDFGEVVHTQYLASSIEGRKIGALDFVIKNLLDSIYMKRRYFSFGISTENHGRTLNEGLIFQKEGFGGRGITHDVYEINL